MPNTKLDATALAECERAESTAEPECKCEVDGCNREAEVTRDGYVTEMCREHNRAWEARNGE